MVVYTKTPKHDPCRSVPCQMKTATPILTLALALASYLALNAASPLPFHGFIENGGQWHETVKFRKAVPHGFLFIGNSGWRYYFSHQWDGDLHAASAEDYTGTREVPDARISQAVDVRFVNARSMANINPVEARSYYHNFFLGQSAGWTPKVQEYGELWYCEMYDKIDIRLQPESAALKYEAVVYPGGNPADLLMEWRGAGDVYLEDGRLVVETAFGQLVEQKPFSYQLIGGDTVEVPSRFKLSRNRVSFEFPHGYDKNHTLVIDPLLIFSTYSGASTDNWGNTSCFDEHGNAYAGGIIFGASTGKFVPAPGVFQEDFRGKFDVVLMKFDSTGSDLQFVTYLGGEQAETPVSLIVNSRNELIVLGTTSSTDFPTTSGAFDETWNRGVQINPFSNAENQVTSYVNGTDIFVSILSEDGTRLLASTFIGGSKNDGILDLQSELTSNYGDQLRGEVAIDGEDNILIASTTMSDDIAITNLIHAWNGGDTDGLLVKMNSDLTEMLWGTYIGGEAGDVLFSVKADGNDGVYAGGSTTSLAFPFPVNGWQAANAGSADGLLVHVNASGTAVDAATLAGTEKKDQIYLIDTDLNGNVYTVGQTRGNYPVSGAVYTNPGSSQFLHKFSSDLSTTAWSTVFGSGSVPSNISPTAFLVSDCGNIYISGWGGGQINQTAPYFQGNTFGLPLTDDAFQPTTDGRDFYLMVLEPDAHDLLYATYFGGQQSSEHVDGGTSRFDKRGVVFQTVCAGCSLCIGCGGNSLYPATENAWSKTNNNPGNCNLAMFKFDLSTLSAAFSTNTPELDKPDVTRGCAPFTFLFTNESIGGESYFWTLGDGSVSTNSDTVVHTYYQAGEYEVSLRVVNPNTCKTEDLVKRRIIIEGGTYSLSPPATVCFGDQAQLTATGGTSYNWRPATGLSDPNVPNPLASPSTTTTYFVTISNDENGCTFEDSVTISVLPEITIESAAEPVYTCSGLVSYNFRGRVSGTENFYWDFGDGSMSTELQTSHTFSPGVFTARLVAANPLCELSSEIRIEAGHLRIPNVFTPNGDHVNEAFEIEWSRPLPVKIFDRSGNLVFSSNSYTKQWTGESLPAGIFFYEVKLPDGQSCNGWVHLMR